MKILFVLLIGFIATSNAHASAITCTSPSSNYIVTTRFLIEEDGSAVSRIRQDFKNPDTGAIAFDQTFPDAFLNDRNKGKNHYYLINDYDTVELFIPSDFRSAGINSFKATIKIQTDCGPERPEIVNLKCHLVRLTNRI